MYIYKCVLAFTDKSSIYTQIKARKENIYFSLGTIWWLEPFILRDVLAPVSWLIETIARCIVSILKVSLHQIKSHWRP